MTAGRAGAGPGPGSEGVPALGGGPSVVTVVTSVVHAGAHVHPEASLGLLFDLREESFKFVARGGFMKTFYSVVSLKQ